METFLPVLCCVFFIVAIGLIIASFKRLESTEYGLRYDVWKKTLSYEVESGGLHGGPPGFKFIKVPSTFITQKLKGEREVCVSRDGLEVEYDVSFQYELSTTTIRSAILKYRDMEKWNKIVVWAARSGIQHACGEFNISNFQNERGIIQKTMFDFVQEAVGNDNADGGLYVNVLTLHLEEVSIPSEYKKAVTEKQSAEEEIGLAKTERQQEVTKANTELLAAEEQARRMIDIANNEANITLHAANLMAEETKIAFQTEAEVIVALRQELNLSTEGVLAFLASEVYERSSQVKVLSAEPAKTSWKEEI